MSKRDWCFRAAFLACCFLAGYLLWANQYLPMVDLPQHAAQLSIWQRWDHPEFNYRLIYEHNWSAAQQIPYLLIYSLTWAFSIHAALRLALGVFLLGIPVATLFLLRETKLPAWLVFLTFPTAFSFSFYWGFINYLAVTPLLILLLAWAHRYSLEPTPARGLKLLVLNHFLFFTHPLGLLFGGLLSVPLIAVRSGHPMVATRRLLPWVLSAPIPLLWLTLTLSQETVEPVQMTVTWWNLGAGRFFEVFCPDRWAGKSGGPAVGPDPLDCALHSRLSLGGRLDAPGSTCDDSGAFSAFSDGVSFHQFSLPTARRINSGRSPVCP